RCKPGSGKSLDCSSLGISSLGQLERIPSGLKSLDLSQNRLLFPQLSPLPAASLKSLNLSHNGVLQGLKGGEAFPNLRTLDLSSNNISSLKDLQFNLFPSLRVLNLAHNHILYLTPNGFQYLKSLFSLNLRGNALVQVQKGSLDGLNQKFSRGLAKRPLPTKCSKTQVPRPQQNRFAAIEGLSFHGLTQLLVLKIKRNALFFGLERIRHLYLDRNKIHSVEKGWLYGLRTLETLSLSHNKIDYIAEDAWEFLGLLRELNLKNNLLQLLERDALRSLPSLTTLLLQDNRISHIDDASFNVFEEVPLIEVLALDGNALSHTIEDSDSPFLGLKHLRKLTLSRNKIKSIGEFAFNGELRSLQEIDLRSNIISTVHEKSIRHLSSLKTLKIDSESFLCDCYLRWFPDFINKTRVTGLNQAVCAHPSNLKGRRVLYVPIEYFTCKDFPKPYILQQPETQITLKGHNLSLYCRAASTSPVEMSFIWKFDSEVIPGSP
ncbi:Leucinerich repeats and immunoglobulinlike domains 3, partial [Caligus rogercresseyi]